MELTKKFSALSSGIKSIGKIGSGENTILRVVESEGGEKFVVRFYPYEPNKEKALEHCYVTTLFKNSGLRTPGLCLKDTSPDTRKRYNFDVVVEEYIEGRPSGLEVLNRQPEIRQRIAQGLVGLHRTTRKTAGKPWRPENERRYPMKYFYTRTRLYLRRIDAYLLKLPKKEQRYFSAKMQKLSEPLNNITEFNLIHGDPQSANILTTESGGIYFLDFGRSCYGFFEEDLVVILNGIYGGGREGFNLFLKDYLQRADSTAETRFQQNFKFFSAFYHLEKASQSAVKVRKIQEGKRKTDQPDASTKLLLIKAQHHWEKFLLAIGR